MIARYEFAPENCRCTVQAFAAGLMSFMGHSPTFKVHEFAGEMQLNPGPPPSARLELTFRADSLELADQVSTNDRREIEGRTRDEVLSVSRFPLIRFEAADIASRPVAGDRFGLRIHGRMTLRGVTTAQDVTAEMHLMGDTLRLSGETRFSLSAFSIPPVTALGGTLKLKDEVRVAFDLVGVGTHADAKSAGGAP